MDGAQSESSFVNFDLPLHYGGFKEQHLRDLYLWMTTGYRQKAALV